MESSKTKEWLVSFVIVAVTLRVKLLLVNFCNRTFLVVLRLLSVLLFSLLYSQVG